MIFQIRNKNNRGESVLLSPKYQTKKEAWFMALQLCAEEGQDILDALDTEEARKTLRFSLQYKDQDGLIKEYPNLVCEKYLDGEKYQSVYIIEQTDLC